MGRQAPDKGSERRRRRRAVPPLRGGASLVAAPSPSRCCATSPSLSPLGRGIWGVASSGCLWEARGAERAFTSPRLPDRKVVLPRPVLAAQEPERAAAEIDDEAVRALRALEQ